MGALGIALVGGCPVFGSIQTMRGGLEISKGKKRTGPGAKVLAVLMILAGIAIPVAVAFWLFQE